MTDLLGDGFADFWAAYPRKEAKIAAEKAYQKALKIASHDEIVAGIDRYRAREKQFIPQPTTYLNQGRWADEDEKPRTFSGGMDKQAAATRAEQLKAHFQRDVEAEYARKAAFNREMDRLRAKNPTQEG